MSEVNAPELSPVLNHTVPFEEALVVHVRSELECVSKVFDEDEDAWRIYLQEPGVSSEQPYLNHLTFTAFGEAADKFEVGNMYGLDAAIN